MQPENVAHAYQGEHSSQGTEAHPAVGCRADRPPGRRGHRTSVSLGRVWELKGADAKRAARTSLGTSGPSAGGSPRAVTGTRIPRRAPLRCAPGGQVLLGGCLSRGPDPQGSQKWPGCQEARETHAGRCPGPEHEKARAPSREAQMQRRLSRGRGGGGEPDTREPASS